MIYTMPREYNAYLLAAITMNLPSDQVTFENKIN